MKKRKNIGKKLLFVFSFLLSTFFYLNIFSATDDIKGINYFLEKNEDPVKIGDEFFIKVTIISKSVNLEINKLPKIPKSDLFEIIKGYPHIEKINNFNFNGFLFKNEYKIILNYKFKALKKGEIDFIGLKISTNLGDILLNNFTIFIKDIEQENLEDFIRLEIQKNNYFVCEEIKVNYFLYTSNEFDSLKNIEIKDRNDYFYEIFDTKVSLVQMLFLNKPVKKYKIAELKIIPKKDGEFFTPEINFTISFISFEELRKIKIEKKIKAEKINFNVIGFNEQIPNDFIYLVGDYSIDYKYEKIYQNDNSLYILNLNLIGYGNHNIIDFSKLLKADSKFELLKIDLKKGENFINIKYYIQLKNISQTNLPTISFSYYNLTENKFKNFIIIGDKINYVQQQKIFKNNNFEMYKKYDFNQNKENSFIKYEILILFLFVFIVIIFILVYFILTLIKINKKSLFLSKNKFDLSFYNVWLNFCKEVQMKYQIDILTFPNDYNFYLNKLNSIFKKSEINKIFCFKKLILEDYLNPNNFVINENKDKNKSKHFDKNFEKLSEKRKNNIISINIDKNKEKRYKELKRLRNWLLKVKF